MGVETIPKLKSDLMREIRAKRKKDGLVEFRIWCTPEQKKKHEAISDAHKSTLRPHHK